MSVQIHYIIDPLENYTPTISTFSSSKIILFNSYFFLLNEATPSNPKIQANDRFHVYQFDSHNHRHLHHLRPPRKRSRGIKPAHAPHPHEPWTDRLPPDQLHLVFPAHRLSRPPAP